MQNDDTGIEKLKIEYYKKNKWNKIVVERATVANNNKIIDLASKGVEVNSDNSKNLVKYIADCVAKNLDTIKTCRAVSHLGWTNNSFMPFDKDIVFDGEKENKYLYASVCKKGKLEDWIEYMKPLRKKHILPNDDGCFFRFSYN